MKWYDHAKIECHIKSYHMYSMSSNRRSSTLTFQYFTWNVVKEEFGKSPDCFSIYRVGWHNRRLLEGPSSTFIRWLVISLADSMHLTIGYEGLTYYNNDGDNTLNGDNIRIIEIFNTLLPQFSAPQIKPPSKRRLSYSYDYLMKFLHPLKCVPIWYLLQKNSLILKV